MNIEVEFAFEVVGAEFTKTVLELALAQTIGLVLLTEPRPR